MQRIRTKEGIVIKDHDIIAYEDYVEMLKDIKGIGIKTVSDIVRVFPDYESLVYASSKGELPFRDDISRKIRDWIDNG